jgi:hypothetical protein
MEHVQTHAGQGDLAHVLRRPTTKRQTWPPPPQFHETLPGSSPGWFSGKTSSLGDIRLTSARGNRLKTNGTVALAYPGSPDSPEHEALRWAIDILPVVA